MRILTTMKLYTKKFTPIFALYIVILLGLVFATNVRAEEPEFVPSPIGSSGDDETLPVSDTTQEIGTTLPSQDSGNQDDAGSILPVTTPSLGGEADHILPVGNGSNGDELANEEVTPIVTANASPTTSTVSATANTANVSFSSGSSSSLPQQEVSTAFKLAPITAQSDSSISCPLITKYMKYGGENDSGEVSELQKFLNNYLGIGLSVTGKYDLKTYEAVRAFQNKFMTETMGPWGVDEASGYVYVTTMKKINEIACKSAIALSAADISKINSVRSKIRAIRLEEELATSTSVSDTDINDFVASSSENVVPTSTEEVMPLDVIPEVGMNNAGEQTAAAGNTSIGQRIADFIMGLFGKKKIIISMR